MLIHITSHSKWLKKQQEKSWADYLSPFCLTDHWPCVYMASPHIDFSVHIGFIILSWLDRKLCYRKLLCKSNIFHIVLQAKPCPSMGVLTYSILQYSNWGLVPCATNSSGHYSLKSSTTSVCLVIYHTKHYTPTILMACWNNYNGQGISDDRY